MHVKIVTDYSRVVINILLGTAGFVSSSPSSDTTGGNVLSAINVL